MKEKMNDKTLIEILRAKIDMRNENDRLYAIKLVERIVFALVAVILLAVVSALIYSVIKK